MSTIIAHKWRCRLPKMPLALPVNLVEGAIMDDLIALFLDVVTSDVRDASNADSGGMPPVPAEEEVSRAFALVAREVGVRKGCFGKESAA